MENTRRNLPWIDLKSPDAGGDRIRRSACLSESTESNTRHLGISDLSKADFFRYFPHLASGFRIFHGQYPLFKFESGHYHRLPL